MHLSAINRRPLRTLLAVGAVALSVSACAPEQPATPPPSAAQQQAMRAKQDQMFGGGGQGAPGAQPGMAMPASGTQPGAPPGQALPPQAGMTSPGH